MSKENSFIIKSCEFVLKNSIYLLVFLIPIFFVTGSSDVLDFNKQALLIVFTLLPLFAWMLKTLILGSVNLNLNKVHLAMAVLFLVYVLSTLFSVAEYGSFWGWPYVTSVSLISLMCFLILYFLVSNNFLENEIFKALVILAISLLLAQAYVILQMVGLPIPTFNLAANNIFNTVGSTGSFNLLLSVFLPLLIVVAIGAKKWLRALLLLNVLLTFIIILLTNYSFVWWTVLAGSCLIVILWIIRRDIFDGRWMFLPMFFLVVSLFFIIFNPQIDWALKNPVEVSLSNKASLDIAVGALKSFPILGSGPGTFIYDFLKYKNKSFNDSFLWNIALNSASSKALTDLATTGVLGALALLSVLLLPIFYGVLCLLSGAFEQTIQIKKLFGIFGEISINKRLLILAVLVALLVRALGYFLYNSSVSLEFVFYFLVASLVALIFKNQKSYTLKPSSFLTLAVAFIFTITFIFGLGFLILGGQRYISDRNYQKALAAFNDRREDDGLKYLKIAATNNAKLDLYHSSIALFSLAKLQDQSVADASSPEANKAVQLLVSDAINFANIAVNINSKNAENWTTRGYVCQNLISFVGDAVNCAIESYDKAIALSPTNPQLLLQQGNVYLRASSLQQKSPQEKDDLLSKAIDKFNKAIDLKKDYALAHFQIGLVYDKMGQKSNAINAFSKALELNPGDQTIPKILDNLKAGKSALDGLVQQPILPNPAVETVETPPSQSPPPTKK